MGCHDEGTKGRTQRQSVDARNGHGNGHSQSELRVEFARHTTQETDGNKYGHKHQGGGNQCRGNAMHGAYRCLIGVLLSVVELRLDCFHHHDGIINDRSDNEHEGKEREHIEREAYSIDEGESAHERYDDGHGRDKGGAHTLEKDVHHEDDQQQGLEQGLHDVLDGSIEEVFLTFQVFDDNARGQALADFLDLAVYGLDNLVGIRTAYLVDHDVHAGMSVGLSDEVVVDGAQFHPCHILDAQHVSVGQRLDDHVLVVLFLLVLSAVFKHILEGGFRIGTECSGGGFNVLLAQYGIDIRW